MNISPMGHIGHIRPIIGLIGLMGSIILGGCVSMFVEPYGQVSSDAEKIRPDGRPVFMPPNAPSISQGYKPKRLKRSKGARSGHEGIDIIERSGTPVLAAASGVVIGSYYEPLYGSHIEISHGMEDKGLPVKSVYLHLKDRLVQKGQVVVRGEQIGTLGRSGLLAGGILHLHFEIRVGAHQDNSVNPHSYWTDGAGVVTCFDPGRQWYDVPFNIIYPVPCRKAEPESK